MASELLKNKNFHALISPRVCAKTSSSKSSASIKPKAMSGKRASGFLVGWFWKDAHMGISSSFTYFSREKTFFVFFKVLAHFRFSRSLLSAWSPSSPPKRACALSRTSFVRNNFMVVQDCRFGFVFSRHLAKGTVIPVLKKLMKLVEGRLILPQHSDSTLWQQESRLHFCFGD